MICFPFAISLRPAILCGGKRPDEDIYRNARLFASVFPDSDPPVPIVCMLNYFRIWFDFAEIFFSQVQCHLHRGVL